MMSFRLRRALVLILGLPLTLASCEAVGVTGPGAALRADLLRHRRLWEEQNIANYRFVYRRACFCGDVNAVEIDVAGGSVADARYVDTGSPVAEMYQSTLPTIDGLFEIIEGALAGRADALRVTYHPTLGYPVEISVDYRFVVADDEFGHTVPSLVVLPP
jgi:hypothetical protein